jgi:UDP-N-acetylmuramoyl-tripeptide--D-alanyl-D-alanine ligase
MKKPNKFISWWMTPKLPPQDIFGLPLLKDKGIVSVYYHLFSKWLIHPVKRRLSRVYLRFLQKTTDIKVIGVTGSAGKSTTTSMIADVLRVKGKTVSTPAGIDPVYNVPNTILKTPIGTKFLVMELSVEYPGEMDYYLWLVNPDIGVITNIFPAHTLFLGGIDGVLKEKSKLITGLGKQGAAVLNAGDVNLKRISGKLKSKIIWFPHVDGDPTRENKNAAKAVGELMGIPVLQIEKSLKSYSPPEHRLFKLVTKKGYSILDDTYNSNPKAAVAALKYFDKNFGKQKRIAVIGDMLELGDYDKEGHRSVGVAAANLNFKVVIGVGSSVDMTLKEITKKSKATKVILTGNHTEALKALKPYLSRGANIFVKGSRSLGLDNLVRKIS